MGIGDRLLAKTANIGSKPTEAAQPRPLSTEPRTSPGRLMDAQNRINSAQSRIKELESQLEERAALEVRLDALIEVHGRRRKLTAEQFQELKNNLAQHALATPILVRASLDTTAWRRIESSGARRFARTSHRSRMAKSSLRRSFRTCYRRR
jgi:ParB family chromosome partitioning protein